MKVGNETSNPLQSTQMKPTGLGRPGIESTKSDSEETEESSSANFSERAKEMATAKKVATDAPDIREEKIRMLKERIANREYNVKPEDVADRMVKEHLEKA